MGQYLIDTNSVSNYLSELFPGRVMDFLDKVTDQIPNISIITEIEILSWKTTEEVEKIVKSFTADSNVHDITPQIVELCVELRRKRNIKTPDAIIAATALAHEFTLITSNEKDFQNIKGLKIINPHNL